MGDGGGGDRGSAVMGGGGAWVASGGVRVIIAGSLVLSGSSGKTSHTVSHSFSISGA